jgi:hypothetical protein
VTSVSHRRVGYIGLACFTIVVGLLVHRGYTSIDGAARDKLGDALWAMMMTWWVSAVIPKWSLWIRGVTALTVCAIVEWSQRVAHPLLDTLRATTVGRLVLGSGFDVMDFVAYTIGVAAAVLFEQGWRIATRQRSERTAARSGNC